MVLTFLGYVSQEVLSQIEGCEDGLEFKVRSIGTWRLPFIVLED